MSPSNLHKKRKKTQTEYVKCYLANLADHKIVQIQQPQNDIEVYLSKCSWLHPITEMISEHLRHLLPYPWAQALPIIHSVWEALCGVLCCLIMPYGFHALSWDFMPCSNSTAQNIHLTQTCDLSSLSGINNRVLKNWIIAWQPEDYTL